MKDLSWHAWHDKGGWLLVVPERAGDVYRVIDPESYVLTEVSTQRSHRWMGLDEIELRITLLHGMQYHYVDPGQKLDGLLGWM